MMFTMSAFATKQDYAEYLKNYKAQSYQLALQSVANLIDATESGEDRNKLTDINIVLMVLRDKNK